jgi:hypothetical protein
VPAFLRIGVSAARAPFFAAGAALLLMLGVLRLLAGGPLLALLGQLPGDVAYVHRGGGGAAAAGGSGGGFSFAFYSPFSSMLLLGMLAQVLGGLAQGVAPWGIGGGASRGTAGAAGASAHAGRGRPQAAGAPR